MKWLFMRMMALAFLVILGVATPASAQRPAYDPYRQMNGDQHLAGC
jgi:hypothetical protein